MKRVPRKKCLRCKNKVASNEKKYCSLKCYQKSKVVNPKDKYLGLIVPKSGCWGWNGYIRSDGYGSFRSNTINYLAHRVSYEIFKGPIPKHLVIDHICRNRCCTNPAHLRAVTRTQNSTENSISLAVKNLHKKICIRGHEFNDKNTRHCVNKKTGRPFRCCRLCDVIRYKKYFKQKTYLNAREDR